MYCAPPDWPAKKTGLWNVACAASSEYHLMFGERDLASQLLSGRGGANPYPQPPAGLGKIHLRVALTAQGVRYAILAGRRVGGDAGLAL